MKFNFSYILQQPFRLLWKHKQLALLNLPGSLAGAGFMLLFPLFFALPFLAESKTFDRILADPWPIFALVIVGPALLFLILMPVSIVTSTALIQGVTALEAGQDLDRLPDLLRRAVPFFWRVSGLMGLQMGVSFLAGMLPFFLIVLTAGLAVICIGPLMPLLTPFIFAFSLVGVLAMHLVIVENVRVIESVGAAWELFKKAWLYLIGVMLLISQVGGLAFGVVFLFPFIAVIPLTIAFVNRDSQTAAVPMGIGIVALLLFFPIAVVGFMVFGTYTQTALALTYLEIRKSVPSLLIKNKNDPASLPS